jgi:hypothetical protein
MKKSAISKPQAGTWTVSAAYLYTLDLVSRPADT